MANKKIRVGIANESLTPEEEHQIEVKVDEMMAINVPEKSSEPEAGGPAPAGEGSDITIPLPEVVTLPAGDLDPKPKTPKAQAKKSGRKKIAITHHEEAAQILSAATDEESGEPVAAGGPDAETAAVDDGVPPPETVLNLDEVPKVKGTGSKIEIKSDDSTAEAVEVQPAGPPPLPGAEVEGATPEDSAAPETTETEVPVEPKSAKTIEIKHVSSGIKEAEPSEEPSSEPQPVPEQDPVPARHKEVVIQPPKTEPPAEPKQDAPKPSEEVSLDEPLQETPAKRRKHAVPKDTDFELLAQTEAIAKAFESKGPSPLAKFSKFFVRLFRTKKSRWLTLAGLLIAALAVIGALPMTRSVAGNLVGLRGSASIRVIDAVTKQPLQGAQVTLGGAKAETNDSGVAALQHVKLGNQQLTVQKIAYDAAERAVFVSIRDGSETSVALTTNGIRYSFKVSDYLSGQGIAGAHVASGQATAAADNHGDVSLVIPKPLDGPSFDISAKGYRTATLTASLDNHEKLTASLVPDRQDIFVSNQSGKYDVYRADIDGRHRQLVLVGTGNENSQLTIIPNSTGDEAALVSTRDNVRDKDGYLLQTLTLINMSNGKSVVVDHSERIQLVDWFGSRIVYVEAKAGASAANPSRYQLFSYDYKTKKAVELDHANYFNDVVSAGGAIYYATSNTYSGGVSQFVKIDADGSNKQVLLTNEAWNIFRTDYDDFMLDTPTSWYGFKLGDVKPKAVPSGYSGTSRLYIDSADGKHSAWVDTRDGKGALVIYDVSSKQEKVLASQDGLTYPVRWLNDSTLIYRVKSAQETADYAVSLQGGQPKKVTDVTDAAGITLWYYY